MQRRRRALGKIFVPKQISIRTLGRGGKELARPRYAPRKIATKAFVRNGTRLPKGLSAEQKFGALRAYADKSHFYIKPYNPEMQRIASILTANGIRVETPIENLKNGTGLFQREGFGIISPKGKRLFLKNPDEYCKQMVRTIVRMHSLGIIHGHPHLGNWAITRRGELILLDLKKAKMPRTVREQGFAAKECQREIDMLAEHIGGYLANNVFKYGVEAHDCGGITSKGQWVYDAIAEQMRIIGANRRRNINQLIELALTSTKGSAVFHALMLDKPATLGEINYKLLYTQELANLRDRRAIPALKVLLENNDNEVALAAAKGLLKNGQRIPEIETSLRKILATEKSAWTRGECLRELVNYLGPEKSIDLVISWFRVYPTGNIALELFEKRMLQYPGARKAISALTGILKEDQTRERKYGFMSPGESCIRAITILAKLGAGEALPAIREYESFARMGLEKTPDYLRKNWRGAIRTAQTAIQKISEAK